MIMSVVSAIEQEKGGSAGQTVQKQICAGSKTDMRPLYLRRDGAFYFF